MEDTIIIKGKAIPTKDGYYVSEYVLRDEELDKYDSNLDIENSFVEIECQIREEEINNDSQEISQGREGVVKYICDIKSIKK